MPTPSWPERAKERRKAPRHRRSRMAAWPAWPSRLESLRLARTGDVGLMAVFVRRALRALEDVQIFLTDGWRQLMGSWMAGSRVLFRSVGTRRHLAGGLGLCPAPLACLG